MSTFDSYAAKYQHLRMERRNGILQVTLHSNGTIINHSRVSSTWVVLPSLVTAASHLRNPQDRDDIIVAGSARSCRGGRET